MSNYRRRRGVLHRPTTSRPSVDYINDGGQDAPMGPKDRAFFRDFFWVIVAVIVAIAVIWQLS
jgi:hypothetical protein